MWSMDIEETRFIQLRGFDLLSRLALVVRVTITKNNITFRNEFINNYSMMILNVVQVVAVQVQFSTGFLVCR